MLIDHAPVNTISCYTEGAGMRAVIFFLQHERFALKILDHKGELRSTCSSVAQAIKVLKFFCPVPIEQKVQSYHAPNLTLKVMQH